MNPRPSLVPLALSPFTKLCLFPFPMDFRSLFEWLEWSIGVRLGGLGFNDFGDKNADTISMEIRGVKSLMLSFQPKKFKLCSSSVAALLHSRSSSSTIDPNTPNFQNLATLLQSHLPRSYLLQIHARIFQVGVHQDNLTATRLIGQYPSCIALRGFHQLQNPNTFPFNAIIRVLAEEGDFLHVFTLFNCLKRRSLLPNDLTFSFLLKACFKSKDARYVEQIHAHIQKTGYLSDPFVSNGLVAVYAKGFNNLVSARKVFDEIPDTSAGSCWTNLITGYAQSGQSEEDLQLFHVMIRQNVSPQNDTMVSVLSACSSLEIPKIEKWVYILSELIDDSMSSKETCHDSVNTVLVYFFGKWGNVEKSRERFDQISAAGKRRVVPWNAMISAYVQNGCPVEGLNLFRMMVEEHITRPNHIQCLGREKEVFEHAVSKDIVLFNAMIMGLAVNGEGEAALRLFYKMPKFGLQPNAGTFLGVLSACSHSGLLEEGRRIFRDLSLSASLKLEHYACYIDLLARVGCIEEAIVVVTSMPFKPNNFVWGALLGGCLLHSRVELAQEVSRRLVQVDLNNSAGYVMLANALASDSQWSDVSALRLEMREKGIKKQPGSSWISVDGVVHEFLVGCLSHPQIEGIYYTLTGLVKHMKTASHSQLACCY